MRRSSRWHASVAALSVALFFVVGCPSGDGESGGGSVDAGDAGGDGIDGPIDPVGDRGPGKVLDVPAARDASTLALELSTTNSGEVSVGGPSFDKKVFEITFAFRSQKLWGNRWRHQASIYVPEKPNRKADDGAFVVVQPSTQNPVKDVSASSAISLSAWPYQLRMLAVVSVRPSAPVSAFR